MQWPDTFPSKYKPGTAPRANFVKRQILSEYSMDFIMHLKKCSPEANKIGTENMFLLNWFYNTGC